LDQGDVVNGLHRGKDGDFKFNLVKLRQHERHESRISDGGRNCAFGDASKERSGGMNVSNTAAEFSMFVDRNENPLRLRQDAFRNIRQMRGLTGKIGSNRVPRDLQKKLLTALRKLEHLGLGHDDAAFFARESSGGAAAL